MTPANIYKGPAASVALGANDLGVPAENNVNITFTPVNYTLHDGQEYMLYGIGRIEVELAETDATTVGYVEAARDTETALTVTALDGTVYTLAAMVYSHTITRGFGETPHIMKITAQKKFNEEGDFYTIA